MCDTLLTSLCPKMHSTQGGRVTHATYGKSKKSNWTCCAQHPLFITVEEQELSPDPPTHPTPSVSYQGRLLQHSPSCDWLGKVGFKYGFCQPLQFRWQRKCHEVWNLACLVHGCISEIRIGPGREMSTNMSWMWSAWLFFTGFMNTVLSNQDAFLLCLSPTLPCDSE